VLPGHGRSCRAPGEAAERYLAHRESRLEQVSEAVAPARRAPPTSSRSVYADVDRALWPAATLSVLAQLEHLRGPGPVTCPSCGTPTVPGAASASPAARSCRRRR
jgi:hypothetical protein